MSILSEALEASNKKDTKVNLDEKVKEICDEIMKQELPSMTLQTPVVSGPNIFLSIEIPYVVENNVGYLSYLCLERNMKSKYFISEWIVKGLNIEDWKLVLDEKKKNKRYDMPKTVKIYRNQIYQKEFDIQSEKEMEKMLVEFAKLLEVKKGKI